MMAAKITYLKTEDFEQQGVFNHLGSECEINNLFFRKGDTLRDYEIKQVLDICNKYHKFDINTLIIKGEQELTIWIEEKSKRIASKSTQNNQVPQQYQVNKQSLPTKTITKKYRGQVYEEVVVDWAAVPQKTQPKPRRKYRGQYID